jgi:hypothetical protein
MKGNPSKENLMFLGGKNYESLKNILRKEILNTTTTLGRLELDFSKIPILDGHGK